MAYFRGDFRSLDQSVDPRGQLYSVIIFTGYNPEALNNQTIGASDSVNLGPYPYRSVQVGSMFNPTTQTWEMIYKNVPVRATSLVMCDHPFEVRYTGDGSPYKNHRCSSATVTFLQDELNTDFISTLGTNCLVILLKWRNSVQEVNGHYEDSETGGTLYKHTHTFNDGGFINTYWDDYYPWEKDAFCYDVEWVGFSTPNVLSCGYDHLHDRFTLECQDAFSTLQYKKYEKPTNDNGVELEVDAIFRALCLLGVYKDIYITTAIHYPYDVSDVMYQHTPYGSVIKWTAAQTMNFIDENGIPMRWFDVLDSIMQYHSLTIVPWKNALYVISDDAIVGGMTEYEHWTLSGGSTNRPWMLPAETISYGNPETINIVDTVNITGDKTCGPSTTISSTDVYDEVKVVCDEMHPENLFPDMEDDDNFDMDLPSGQPVAEHVSMKTGWSYWEASAFVPIIDSIKCYHHGTDQAESDGASGRSVWWTPDSAKTLIQQSDLVITTGNLFCDAFRWGQWCCIIDENEFPMVVDDTTIPHSSSFKRKFYFKDNYSIMVGMGPNGANRVSPTGATSHFNYDNKTTTTHNTPELDYQQTLLEIHSMEVLFNAHQYLNFKGTWKFYHNSGDVPGPDSYGFPSANTSYSATMKWDAVNAFIYCYVRFVPNDPLKPTLYLDCQNNAVDYSWTPTKVMSKLPLDTNVSLIEKTNNNVTYKDCAGAAVSFASPVQNIDGLYFSLSADDLPVANGFCEPGHIEVLIDRQIGPTSNPGEAGGYACASVYTLEDFELNVVSATYVDSKGKKEPEKDNSEYKNVLLENAVNECPQVDMILSSTPNRGLSYAETCRWGIRRRTQGENIYTTKLEMVNEVSGVLGIPEQLRIDGTVRQYKEPLLMFNMPLFSDGISPISRFMWNRLGDKRMVVDTLNIDYEYEQCDIGILQVRPYVSGTPTIKTTNATRNYRRTGDIFFQGRDAVRKYEELPQESRQTGNDVEMDTYNVILDTDNVNEGATRMYTDFRRGQVHVALPGEGVAITNTNGHVVLTTT